jgi:hypothetical protein
VFGDGGVSVLNRWDDEICISFQSPLTRWSGYHRRSLVETKMRCFKLLGERVMARDFDRQVAELQVRAAVLNRFTRLGTPVTVPVL